MTPALLLLLACGTPSGNDDAPAIDAAAVLTRASVDLRGRLPTPAELDAAAADLDAALEAVLTDPAFGRRYADLVAPVWRTRVDTLQALPTDLRQERSLGDEPLRILARIADDDLPYTELVTGDWTMADAYTASVWPLDLPPGAEAWQEARYTDGRPAAGVLSTNGLWWRYGSTAENANRGRANALSRILLCADFSSRPVHFERTTDVFDAQALRDETRNNLACANCHSALDPIGSYLYGFWYFDEASTRPTYDAGSERLWRATLGTAPGFYGQPGYTLSDLGNQVAGDPRFVECAVETTFEALLRRPAGPDDHARLAAHREAFLADGLTLRGLVRSILADDAWRAAGDDDHADGGHLMTPVTYASVIEDLTGWRWTYLDLPMLDSDVAGVRTLAGGADGREVTAEATLPSATTSLTIARVSEMAALYAVAHDAERPADRRLFQDADLTGGGDPSAVLVDLHRRVLGRVVSRDGDEVRLGLQLYAEALAIERDPARAWAVVLAWLLRDPDLLIY